ncbi:MAG: hypothetical protein J5846_06975 [Desulfovibrio sp.]|nr:hypothetical protein [Desulfovibrio sp.]
MAEIIRLSGEQKKLLLNLSVALGKTADEMLAEQYDEVSPDFARGYLSGFSQSASDEKVLLAYFLLRMCIKQG